MTGWYTEPADIDGCFWIFFKDGVQKKYLETDIGVPMVLDEESAWYVACQLDSMMGD